ncbi:MAG: SGNH/GDSL hydrolase family protein [Deltaproteobacteria bacterium]|nr:SGNH/GDSL hydrolase family protein [Deltaproteobacteria bacterium]
MELPTAISFRGFIGRLVLILAGSGLGFTITEYGFHLLSLGEQGFYQWDPDRGWGLRPEAAGWQRREGKAFVHINRDGMRDHEHSHHKPKNTIRIAFIGDSFTEAEQVDLQDDYVSVVERRLKTCTRQRGIDAETLNFGCDSYGTAQELITVNRDVWKFSPDIVVLVFFAGNDIRNNSPELEWHLCQPFYLLQNDQLVLGGPFLDSRFFRAKCAIKFESRRSAVLNVLGDAVVRLRSAAKAKAMILEREPSSAAASSGMAPVSPHELGLADAIYEAPSNQAWKYAWTVTEKLIIAMNREVTRHGARFLVVTATVSAQVHPDRAWRARYEKSLGIKDLLYPDSRIRELGLRAGFPVLNLAPAFQTYAEQHGIFLHGFANTQPGVGHWNETGHRLAGELIAQRLCDMLTATGPKPMAARTDLGSSEF